MVKTVNLIGQKFGKLTVIDRVEDYVSPKGKKIPKFLCKCDCGNTIEVVNNSLKRGLTKSCHRCNIYDLSGEYGICTTFNGEQFYFDLEDYDKVKAYQWYIASDGYVITTSKIRLHRLLLNCPDNMVVDHKNHQKNDNRKSNLRICTLGQNAMNRSIGKNNTTGVIGVDWNKGKHKWRASITVNKKYIFLGFFSDFNEAVEARQEAEEKYFGKYSFKNSV